MTSPSLRDLLDEATLDIPPSIAQPPLSAIHDRVKRRRARSTAFSAVAAAAIVLAIAIPSFRAKVLQAPAASPPPIGWEFGFIDGDALTIYATKLPKCTYLNNPAAVATRDGDSYTIRIIGDVDTSGCVGPDSQGVSRSELAQATVRLDSAVPVDLIKDAGGQTRPIYARSELPVGFPEGVSRAFSWGAGSQDGGAAEFVGSFQFQKSISPPLDLTELSFRGLGLSATPPTVIAGEEATFGSIRGWLAPTADGKSHRFVWCKPRGSSWITYELFPRLTPTTKAEFVNVLNQMTWP